MEKEPFTSLVLPESVFRDDRLTYFERILIIYIVSLCKKMVIFVLLISILWRGLIVSY